MVDCFIKPGLEEREWGDVPKRITRLEMLAEEQRSALGHLGKTLGQLNVTLGGGFEMGERALKLFGYIVRVFLYCVLLFGAVILGLVTYITHTEFKFGSFRVNPQTLGTP